MYFSASKIVGPLDLVCPIYIYFVLLCPVVSRTNQAAVLREDFVDDIISISISYLTWSKHRLIMKTLISLADASNLVKLVTTPYLIYNDFRHLLGQNRLSTQIASSWSQCSRFQQTLTSRWSYLNMMSQDETNQPRRPVTRMGCHKRCSFSPGLDLDLS